MFVSYAESATGKYWKHLFSIEFIFFSGRNSENLEIHQRYYCKGPPEAIKRSSHFRPEAAKLAAAMELAALATPPPFPSPGPLLGSTPLVGGYNEPPATKRPRLSSDERPPSTASLRSLEELSRSPRPMQMFGGKVKNWSIIMFVNKHLYCLPGAHK